MSAENNKTKISACADKEEKYTKQLIDNFITKILYSWFCNLS